MSNRDRIIALIHVGAKELGLDEDQRRDLYEGATGERSLSVMSAAQRTRVIDRMKELGFVPKKGTAKSEGSGRRGSDKAFVRLIYALWRSIGEAGGLRDPSPAGLRAFVQERTDVSDPEWLTYAQADPVIRALKAMEARAKGHSHKGHSAKGSEAKGQAAKKEGAA